MPVQIRKCDTADELEEVYRFRYRVYVEEMGRVQKHADHKTRRVEEPLDQYGFVVGAWEDGNVVGTIRFNYPMRGDIGYYADLYQMERFAPYHPDRTSITTKLMVASEHRSGTLGLRLCKFAFASGSTDGILFDFMDCNPPLVPFFRRMGYRQLIPDIVHPEYGHVHPMVCSLRDAEYLRACGSAFIPVACDLPAHRSAIDFFNRKLIPEALGQDGSGAGLTPEQRQHLLAGATELQRSSIVQTATTALNTNLE